MNFKNIFSKELLWATASVVIFDESFDRLQNGQFIQAFSTLVINYENALHLEAAIQGCF